MPPAAGPQQRQPQQYLQPGNYGVGLMINENTS